MHILGIDLRELAVQFGVLFVFIVIFAESSLIFFLPGDSFLFLAGILAYQHVLSIWSLIIFSFIAAITGNSLGYFLGRTFGVKIFSREDSKLFKPSHITTVQAFFDRYGAMTIILARFIPAIRTFAPIAGGIAKMNYQLFLFYNIVGALLWVVSMSLAGYFLGSLVPNIDKYILPIIGIIIVISFIPAILKYYQSKNSLIK